MTTFIPTEIRAQASKAGKTYWKIATNQGEATCFDYPIVQEIEKSLNKPISLYDLETNEKGFINIRPARNKPANAQPIVAPAVVTQQASSDNFKEARMSKDVSIYTSYAKDLFLEMRKNQPKVDREVMKEAIELIKQAKVSFERSEIYSEAKATSEPIAEDKTSPKVTATFQG
jgi:hypothetical protein